MGDDSSFRAQISVALDRSSGRVEQAWNDPQDADARLAVHPFLCDRAMTVDDREVRHQHPPVRAVSAHLWSRHFEPAEDVLADLNVDTYAVTDDGDLEPVSLCERCRAMLPGVAVDGSSPVPTFDPQYPKALTAALNRPVNYLRRVPPHRFAHGALDDPRTPPDLRALFDAVETGRGNSAMVLTSRDPDLAPEAALDIVLANPPKALWPGTRDVDGGGFRTWPDCPGHAALYEIDRAAAHKTLRNAIRLDFAYTIDDRVDPDRAADLADSIIAFLGPDTRWWTNADVQDLEDGATPRGWQPLTTATFDWGVIGVDDDQVLVAWLMDED